MEWLALDAGVKFQGIPYKGSGPGAAALAACGAETIPSTPAELAARIKRDVDPYAPVVQRAGGEGGVMWPVSVDGRER